MSHIEIIGLSLLVQSTLLLSVGLLTARLLQRRGPTIRAFVLQMTLLGVALSTVLSVCFAGHIRAIWQLKTASPVPATLSPMAVDMGTIGTWHTIPLPADRIPPTPSAATEAAPLKQPARGVLLRSVSLLGVLSDLWLMGIGMLLLWLFVCQGRLVLLRLHAMPLSAGCAFDTLVRLSQTSKRPVPLLLANPDVRSPFLVGIFRPVIFLPATWDKDYDDATLHVIIAHELAHHQRRDCAWTLLLRLTTALLWPQPLLWLLGRHLDQATEEACDLMALAPDCPPRRYADCLLTLAERAAPPRMERTLGAGVTPIRSALGRRILNVLDRRNLAMSSITPTIRCVLVMGALLLTSLVSVAVSSALAAPTAGTSTQTASTGQAPTNTPDKTRPFYGFGLAYSPPTKFMNLYRILAIPGSPTAKTSIPTDHWVELIRLNGLSAQTSPDRVTALFRSSSRLRVTYREFGDRIRKIWPMHTVLLTTKGTFPVPSIAAQQDAVLASNRYWQDKLAIAEKSLAIYNQKLDEALHLALPNTDPQTFAKARNLEMTIGGYNTNIQTVEQDTATWSTRQNPKSREEARRFIAERETELKPYFAQEARLFPHTTQMGLRLARIHKIAVLRQVRVPSIEEIKIVLDVSKRYNQEVRTRKS